MLVGNCQDFYLSSYQENITLAQYFGIGQLIATLPEVVGIRSTIESLRNSPKPMGNSGLRDPKPFVVVSCPSGSGKTQLPFALCHAGIKVVYFPLNIDENAQAVYEPFRPLTQMIQEVIKLTSYYAMDSNDIHAKSMIDGQENHLVALLSAIVGMPQPTGLYHLLAEYVGQHLSEMPIFVIDEAVQSFGELKDDPEKYFLILRSILRSLGLVGVFMGTNTRAENFHMSHSRGGDPYAWCIIFGRLPKISLQHFENIRLQEALNRLPLHLREFLKLEFTRTIPLFAHYFINIMKSVEGISSNSMSAVEILEHLLLSMNSQIYDKKGFMLRSIQGLAAQVVLLGGPAIITSSKSYLSKKSADFICCHFAQLICDVPVALDMSGDGLVLHNDRKKKWLAKGKFPQLNHESLLFLLFTMWKDGENSLSMRRNNCDEIINVTSAFALNQIEQEHNETKVKIFTENNIQLSRDGPKLEHFASIGCIVASHARGLQGIPVDDFILHLVGELCKRKHTFSWKNGSAPTQLCPVLPRRIPFLSAINDFWRNDIHQIEGIYCGDFHRTVNKTRIDLRATHVTEDVVFSGECKNYDDPVDFSVMLKILKRIPSTSHLHFIFLSLPQQKGYFQQENQWPRTLRENPDLQNTAVVTLRIRSHSEIELTRAGHHAPFPQKEDCNRLAIIMDVESLLSL